MVFNILVGQRKCRYPGQYAPEALAVMDDNANDDNPEFLAESHQDYRATGEFDSLAIIRVRVDDKEIDKALNPTTEIIGGDVI